MFGGGIIPDADIPELGSEVSRVAKDRHWVTPGTPTHDIVAWVKSTLG